MKAIVCKAFAPINELSFEEFPEPSVAKNELKISIRAAGVNFPDALLVQGLYQAKPELPFVPGSEFSGVVEEVGAGIEDYKVGDNVIGLSSTYGAYAEKITCPAAKVMPMPDFMSYEVAASLVLAHGTAHHALKQRGQLKPGETLLVLGAAGGTGIAAVQIGKAMGAHVIAACSSEDKLELARSNGADELINYKDNDLKNEIKRLTNGQGVDVVYDPVGGEFFDACARCMKAEGRLLVVGFASGSIPKLPVNLTLVKEFSVVGVFFGAYTRRDKKGYADNMQELFNWYQQEKVSLIIDKCYPLAQTAQALQAVANRQVMGKVILTP